MELKELCDVMQYTSFVQITILNDPKEMNALCSKWRFHGKQELLQPDALKKLLKSLRKDKILLYTDCFLLRFAFLWIKDTPVCVGPYCTELLSEYDVQRLSAKYEITGVSEIDVLTYRTAVPVVEEKYILHVIQGLMKYMLNETTSRKVVKNTEADFTISQDKPLPERASYALVTERYRIEQELMECIRSGNRTEALRRWREVHNSMEYLKQSIGYTLENARISAAITRTAIRIAGIQAGLPAELSDRLSSESAQIIRNSKTIEEINTEHERLITEYCNAVRSFKKKDYSVLVLSVLYHLDHNYHTEIIMKDLAKDLNVTVNHMITQFHKETGLTPVQYLRNERLSHAALLLAGSSMTIQEISFEVGISDPVYFARLFKQQYGISPSQYRKYGENKIQHSIHSEGQENR